MNLRPLHLIIISLFTIFTLSSFKGSISSFEKKSFQDSISKEEAVNYYEKQKSNIGFAPNYQLSQLLKTEKVTYLRIPLAESYSSLYLSKNDQNKIEGTIIRAFPIDSVVNFKRYSGAIFWQKVGTNELSAMLFMEGNYMKTLSYGFHFEKNVAIDNNLSQQESCWMKVVDIMSRLNQCKLNAMKSIHVSAKKRKIGELSLNSILAGERFLIKEQIAVMNYYGKLYVD